MKGEFHKGERIYNVILLMKVYHSKTYLKLMKSAKQFGNLIQKLAEILLVFEKIDIIHFDFKPENILVHLNENFEISDLKIIDFGSSFQLDDFGNLTGATPEYLSPEVLQILCNGFKKGNLSQIEILKEKVCPWSVDVWSLGAVILEILIGLPHWISYKCKLLRGGKDIFRQGFFSSKCRDLEKIRQKQRELPIFFQEKLLNLIHFSSVEKCEELIDLLSKMLSWDPQERISPLEILNHPFLYRGII